MQRSNIAMPLLCRRPWTDPFAIKWVQLDGNVLPFWKLSKGETTRGVPNFHYSESHLKYGTFTSVIFEKSHLSKVAPL